MVTLLDSSVLIAAERGKLDLEAILRSAGSDRFAVAAVTASEIPFALVLMAASVVGLMLFYRKKGWIGRPERDRDAVVSSVSTLCTLSTPARARSPS